MVIYGFFVTYTTWSSLLVSFYMFYISILNWSSMITHDCSYFFMILLFYIEDVRNGRLCLYLFMYLSCVYLIPFDYGLL